MNKLSKNETAPSIVSCVKKEGEAGLYYAYNPTNEYIYAEYSVNGIKYTCPYCGAVMHPTTTPKGKRIYVRCAGEVHTDSRCITIERKKSQHSFAGITPQKVFTSFCSVSPRTKKTEPTTISNTSSDSVTATSPIIQDDFCVLSPFSSLKQIYDEGIDCLNPNDKQGDYKVSDYVLTYKYAKEFFDNPNFILGGRIIYAKFLYADFDKSSLIFAMFCGMDFSVRFRILFTSKTAFNDYSQKFYTKKIDSNGRTQLERIVGKNEVLLCSDNWEYIDSSRCKDCCYSKDDKFCKECKGLYQTIFINSKQFYLISGD